MSSVNFSAGVLNGNSHPVHMHGHRFEVLKVGWPAYSPATKYYAGPNPDINCTINELCNEVDWADPAWRGGNIPGANTANPPQKDTVVVPTGGYVVIRFKADNPGMVNIVITEHSIGLSYMSQLVRTKCYCFKGQYPR